MSFKKCFLVIWIFLSVGVVSASADCSCHELVWKDHGIQLFRLVVAPHSASQPFWHSSDYTFIPLSDQETLEGTRPSAVHNQANGIASGTSLWVTHDATIRFVHPTQTEPEEGQVIYNSSDRPYIAIEIFTDDRDRLPSLQSRLSLFGPSREAGEKWLSGAYAISIQSLGPLAEISTTSGGGVMFSSASITLDAGTGARSIAVGQAVPLTTKSGDNLLYRNISTVSSRVIIISKDRQPVLMAANR